MAKKSDELSAMKGPQKAAMLMLALGEENSTKIWPLLDDEEIRDLSQIMATLGTINSEMVERLFIEFVNRFSTAGAVVGTYENTERLLMKALPKGRVELIMDEIRGPAGRTMWDKLGNVNETMLASYLKNEYPQTVDVVLAKIKTDHAARVLAALPEDFAMEVVLRMLRMEAVQKDILDHVERTLRSEFMTNLARSAQRDSHEHMADIFNNLDRNTESRFMTALEERNRRRDDANGYEDPVGHCEFYDIGRLHSFAQRFMYSGNNIVIGAQEQIMRVVDMSRKQHLPDTIRLWLGDPIGRWEGDTLVIDSTNFNGKTRMALGGDFYSANAHVIERYTMKDSETITWTMTIDDPTVYTRPWTFTTAAPALTSLSSAYLPRNIRPQVVSITVHPPGVVFQKPFSSGETEIAGLDEESQDRRSASSSLGGGAPPLGRRIVQKGLQTFAWKAEDEGSALGRDGYDPSRPRLGQHLDPADHQPRQHAGHRRPHDDRRQGLRQ